MDLMIHRSLTMERWVKVFAVVLLCVMPCLNTQQQGHAPQQGQPLQGQPLQGQPLQGQPLQGQPPQGQPPQGMPPQGQPPQGMPPQGQPIQGQPPQGMPPQGQPIQGQPPRQPPVPLSPQQKELEFDFDPNPGIQHEFKVEIPAAKEECLFQFLRKDAQLHMSFEVLRGADRNIDMVIRAPDGHLMARHMWTNRGTSDLIITHQGVYAFCMDNSFSRFSAKLVYFFMASYVQEDWQQYAHDMEEIDGTLTKFTESLAKVDEKVRKTRVHQTISRQHAVADWYIIKGNNQYVQKWSIVMVSVVMATSALQAFFVRRLFHTQEPKPGAKPRA